VDSAEVRRRYGRVFETVAEDYDRERRAYPDELVDRATADLADGDTVLEVGAGTGLLTEQLVARGLRVRALEPGPEMVRVARRRVGAEAPVQFDVGRFEDADVSAGYGAVFCASAWHWLDPARSWRTAHAALTPGGRLCLLQDFGVTDERVAESGAVMLAGFRRAAPELAERFPTPREAAEVIAGARERLDDISALWSWFSSYDLQDSSAAELFDDVRFETVLLVIEQTAEQFNAYFRTTSFHARLSADERERFEEINRRAADELGGMLRYANLAVLVSGRRVG
jgi:SAM-dependent methyltransferase